MGTLRYINREDQVLGYVSSAMFCLYRSSTEFLLSGKSMEIIPQGTIPLKLGDEQYEWYVEADMRTEVQICQANGKKGVGDDKMTGEALHVSAVFTVREKRS